MANTAEIVMQFTRHSGRAPEAEPYNHMLVLTPCLTLTWSASPHHRIHQSQPRGGAAARHAITTSVAALDECAIDDPLVLCKYDPEADDARFANEPLAVAARLASIGVAAARIKLADDDGATLRSELSSLGPVFCKVGQTMATRPDIVGLEISRNLGKLQDAAKAEPDPAVAMETLSTALGGDVASQLADISPEPVAAASLAEVYRARLVADGTPVALKIQRPGLERKVALDLYCLRRALALAQERFQIGGDVAAIVAVLDEVGAGLFAELDFSTEARHIQRFERLYGDRLSELGVLVPTVVEELTSQRVMVTHWIDGTPPRSLSAARRQQLARTAVRCLAMQLMSDGFIHCDPHEGNLLGLDDGRVALLDFGLMAQMRTDHQEAMAHGVVNILAENYEALEQVFRGMGVLDVSKPDLRRPGVDEPFVDALQRCMSGGDAAAPAAPAAPDAPDASAAPAASAPRRKIVQDADGADRRRAFGQLYEELGELAFKYYFTIPSYYILVMRAFVTLEGIALSADDDFNMYSATAPYAARKLLTPQTAGGRALLRAAVGSADGRRAMRQVLAPLVRRSARALLNPLRLLRRLLSTLTGGRLLRLRVA